MGGQQGAPNAEEGHLPGKTPEAFKNDIGNNKGHAIAENNPENGSKQSQNAKLDLYDETHVLKTGSEDFQEIDFPKSMLNLVAGNGKQDHQPN